MERLSALDAEFLHLEDSNAHMHIAGICTFEGSAPTTEELEELIVSKLHLLPRYRQRIRTVPLELGRPVWVDDPHFNPSYHVRHTALPAPGDDTALRRLMGRLMSQPLDRARPLWEAWITEGLEGDRWGIIFKVHHCMVDGVAGVGLLEMMLDISAEGELPEPQPWSPEPEPSSVALVTDAWKGALGDGAKLASHTFGMVTDPAGALRHAGELGSGLLRLTQRLGNTPSSSIEGTIGPHRVWCHTAADLADVKRIGKAHGATVNDVVLAAITSGFRDLLLSRGDDPDTTVVRSLVPVSVRKPDADGIPDNRVSALLLELPVAVSDPLERLSEVQAAMADLKGSHMAEAGEVVTDIGNLAPPALLGAATRLGMRAQHFVSQRSISTVTTNVPGPQFPLYCLGREMLEYLPFVPITPGVRIGTAILSYNGVLAFGITGDWDTAKDIDLLAAGIDTAMEAMRG
ncbi:MAG: wax ester/triacylglycerol synthase family O-acyltransferase [Microthrixaceae bacterium]